MIELIKIGNSQGVRIPKPLIEQAQLANSKLKFILVDDGLLISPVKEPRISWENSIKEAQAEYSTTLLEEEKAWLDMDLSTDEDLEW